MNCSATADPQPVISRKRQGAQLPVGRSRQQINGALVIRDIRNEDEGNYICVAKSAGVFDLETGTDVEVQRAKGELINDERKKFRGSHEFSELTLKATIISNT